VGERGGGILSPLEIEPPWKRKGKRWNGGVPQLFLGCLRGGKVCCVDIEKKGGRLYPIFFFPEERGNLGSKFIYLTHPRKKGGSDPNAGVARGGRKKRNIVLSETFSDEKKMRKKRESSNPTQKW